MKHLPNHRTHPLAALRPSPSMLAVAALLATLSGPAAQAQTGPLRDTSQLSPSGYTGAINTPTADVLPMGSATLALTNSIPEQAQRFKGSGGFGGLNLGFGLFPGLELVGRLAFDGDLQCNLFSGAACKGGTRDLSVGGKYQLPLTLPFNTRLAVGATDYGGAATNYRQAYGVATSTLGPVDVSLGYSKGSS
ncbi:MAG: YjbH domain-containing protein, partial [Burkholderiales bacterium]|nr:YjbH domain-containing protein [Burkholderiales bacterium]